MEVAILGPVEVTAGGHKVEIAAPKERAVLATLALHVGRLVSLDHLSSAVWGDDPPATATRTLRTYVSHLRDALGDERIETGDAGYRLRLDPGSVDASRLECDVAEASAALEHDQPAVARDRFAAAAAMWRGDPLTDLADAPLRWGEQARLRELTRRARTGRIRADLDLGRHELVISELERLVATEPLDEEPWSLLGIALYRSGRQIDALRACRRSREQLLEQGGVEPGPALQRLEWQILNQDEQLDLVPPPRTVDVPNPIDSFIGRGPDLERVGELIRQQRLVTLHGTGGVGKSRLAVEIAHHEHGAFPDGVVWIDVTRAGSFDELVALLAGALALAAAPGRSVRNELIDYARHRHMLFVLDNCEPIAETIGAFLTWLLKSAPHVHVLATSRVVLDVPGEIRWQVEPLTVPPPQATDGEVRASEAAELFVQRALAQHPRQPGKHDLASIADLVRYLGGLPLAIELAAARTRHLTPAQVRDRIVHHLSALGSAPPRGDEPHRRTIEATIDWSYRDLDETTRRMFEVVAALPDTFDLATGEAVCSTVDVDQNDTLDRLGKLVDASLLTLTRVRSTERYGMLPVVRQFGVDRLRERGGEEAARQAHADHFRRFAREAGREIVGHEAGIWWDRVLADRIHIQAAVAWSHAHDDRTATFEFAPLLANTFEITVSPDSHETERWFGSLLEQSEGSPARLRAWAWLGRSTPAWLAGDAEGSLAACETALSLFDDEPDPAGTAAALWKLGDTTLLALGDMERAGELLGRAAEVARSADAPVLEAWTTSQLAQGMLFANLPLEWIEELLVRAEGLAQEGLHTLRAHLAMNRAYFAYRAGDLDATERAAERAREFAAAGRSSIFEQIALVGLGAAAIARSHHDAARSLLIKAAQLAIDSSNSMQFGVAAQALAAVVDHDERPADAARLWGAGTQRAPEFPFVRDRWFPAAAQRRLGKRFDNEVRIGRVLTSRQVIDLAVG